MRNFGPSSAEKGCYRNVDVTIRQTNVIVLDVIATLAT